ncbi:hypothetical protein R1sor_009134 [Riccia sorocarpa]|uniref:Uncharacterized protein n=1 Tax=Riccia sorocarpa TaxID=122646 RepID=A0ABD3H864_9MARC
MDVCAQLSDPLFQDIQLVPCEPDGTTSILAQFCAVRWKLHESSVYINERREILDRQATVLVNQSKPGFWDLKVGLTYIVFGTAADTTPTVVQGSLSRPSEIVDSRTASKLNWEGVDCNSSIVSGLEACLRIEGTSELAELEFPNFEHRHVSFLPDSYDGNVIFELPTSKPEELSKKGDALVRMDRGNDCWLWTKCITTSAQIGGEKRSDATGSLHRHQDTTDNFQTPQDANCSFQPENAAGSFPVEEDPNADFGPQQDAAHPSDQQNDMANTHITELSSDSEVRHTRAFEQARVGQRARPADAPPRTDQDSDDDVVVLRVTPRATLVLGPESQSDKS